MSKMRKSKRCGHPHYHHHGRRKDKRIRLDKSLPWLAPFQPARRLVRSVWNGKKQEQNNPYNQDGKRMPKLRISLLEKLLNIFNYIGDHSGCHQIPERCFCIKGYTFPLCARCTGVFAGQAGFFLLFLPGIRPTLIVSLLCLMVMGLDWGIQYLKIRQSTNFRRFFTGILGGFGMFGLYYQLLKFILDLLKK